MDSLLFWIVAGIAVVGLVVYYFWSQRKGGPVSERRPPEPPAPATSPESEAEAEEESEL